jgi:hypothetical protein
MYINPFSIDDMPYEYERLFSFLFVFFHKIGPTKDYLHFGPEKNSQEKDYVEVEGGRLYFSTSSLIIYGLTVTPCSPNA